jgi:hypothetical protein
MLQNELTSGLNNMKFSLNHSYRFEKAFIPFLAGFLQASSIFVIEIVNFIVILTSADYLSVVMNFLALAVISEFDDAFYTSIVQDDLKEILSNPAFEDMYTITRTSSAKAKKSD